MSNHWAAVLNLYGNGSEIHFLDSLYHPKSLPENLSEINAPPPVAQLHSSIASDNIHPYSAPLSTLLALASHSEPVPTRLALYNLATSVYFQSFLNDENFHNILENTDILIINTQITHLTNILHVFINNYSFSPSISSFHLLSSLFNECINSEHIGTFMQVANHDQIEYFVIIKFFISLIYYLFVALFDLHTSPLQQGSYIPPEGYSNLVNVTLLKHSITSEITTTRYLNPYPLSHSSIKVHPYEIHIEPQFTDQTAPINDILQNNAILFIDIMMDLVDQITSKYMVSSITNINMALIQTQLLISWVFAIIYSPCPFYHGTSLNPLLKASKYNLEQYIAKKQANHSISPIQIRKNQVFTSFLSDIHNSLIIIDPWNSNHQHIYNFKPMLASVANNTIRKQDDYTFSLSQHQSKLSLVHDDYIALCVSVIYSHSQLLLILQTPDGFDRDSTEITYILCYIIARRVWETSLSQNNTARDFKIVSKINPDVLYTLIKGVINMMFRHDLIHDDVLNAYITSYKPYDNSHYQTPPNTEEQSDNILKKNVISLQLMLLKNHGLYYVLYFIRQFHAADLSLNPTDHQVSELFSVFFVVNILSFLISVIISCPFAYYASVINSFHHKDPQDLTNTTPYQLLVFYTSNIQSIYFLFEPTLHPITTTTTLAITSSIWRDQLCYEWICPSNYIVNYNFLPILAKNPLKIDWPHNTIIFNEHSHNTDILQQYIKQLLDFFFFHLLLSNTTYIPIDYFTLSHIYPLDYNNQFNMVYLPNVPRKISSITITNQQSLKNSLIQSKTITIIPTRIARIINKHQLAGIPYLTHHSFQGCVLYDSPIVSKNVKVTRARYIYNNSSLNAQKNPGKFQLCDITHDPIDYNRPLAHTLLHSVLFHYLHSEVITHYPSEYLSYTMCFIATIAFIQQQQEENCSFDDIISSNEDARGFPSQSLHLHSPTMSSVYYNQDNLNTIQYLLIILTDPTIYSHQNKPILMINPQIITLISELCPNIQVYTDNLHCKFPPKIPSFPADDHYHGKLSLDINITSTIPLIYRLFFLDTQHDNKKVNYLFSGHQDGLNVLSLITQFPSPYITSTTSSIIDSIQKTLQNPLNFSKIIYKYSYNHDHVKYTSSNYCPPPDKILYSFTVLDMVIFHRNFSPEKKVQLIEFILSNGGISSLNIPYLTQGSQNAANTSFIHPMAMLLAFLERTNYHSSTSVYCLKLIIKHLFSLVLQYSSTNARLFQATNPVNEILQSDIFLVTQYDDHLFTYVMNYDPIPLFHVFCTDYCYHYDLDMLSFIMKHTHLYNILCETRLLLNQTSGHSRKLATTTLEPPSWGDYTEFLSSTMNTFKPSSPKFIISSFSPHSNFGSSVSNDPTPPANFPQSDFVVACKGTILHNILFNPYLHDDSMSDGLFSMLLEDICDRLLCN